jgi:RecG-like helicase
VWWFVSGRRAYEIIQFYTKKLKRGARFITFGQWSWDKRRGTYSLQLHRPADELEMLVSAESDQTDDGNPDQVEANIGDPTLAVIHVGRRVPVYRKLGDFNSKRVREIVHAVLTKLDDKEIAETLPTELRQRTNSSDEPRLCARSISTDGRVDD